MGRIWSISQPKLLSWFPYWFHMIHAPQASLRNMAASYPSILRARSHAIFFFCSSVKSILFSAVSYRTSLSPTKSSFVKIIIFTYYNLFSIAIFHQKVRPLLSVCKVSTKEALLILPFWSQFRNETTIDNNRFYIGHINPSNKFQPCSGQKYDLNLLLTGRFVI